MVNFSLYFVALAGAVAAVTATKSPIVPALDCSRVQKGPGLDNFATLEYQTSVAAVQHLLARYPLAIDSGNWDAVKQLFTSDAVATFPAPLGVLSGPEQIAGGIGAGLSNFGSTQHAYGTQIIELCSKTKAVAVTYLTATHFFVPTPADLSGGENIDKVLYTYGQYQDVVVKGKDGKWRISERELVIMGPNISGVFP